MLAYAMAQIIYRIVSLFILHTSLLVTAWAKRTSASKYIVHDMHQVYDSYFAGDAFSQATGKARHAFAFGVAAAL
jgi:hypothetical protein